MSREQTIEFVTDLPKSPKDLGERFKKIPFLHKLTRVVLTAALTASQCGEKMGIVFPTQEGNKINPIMPVSNDRPCSFNPDCPASAPYCSIDYSLYPQYFPDHVSAGVCSSSPSLRPPSCGLGVNWGDECGAIPGTSCIPIFRDEGSEGICLNNNR